MADRVAGPYTEQNHPAYRTGIVSAVESVPPYRVRVRFPDRDNIVSWWLPVLVPKVMSDKFFWQPDVDEQVACLMDEWDENGSVVGSVPSQVDAAPAGLTPNDFYIGFKDGTVIHYNRSTHVLSITTSAGASILLDGSGNVTINGAATISLAQGGLAANDALALVSKLVVAFNDHQHPNGTDGSPTGTPITPWTPTTIESTLVKASN